MRQLDRMGIAYEVREYKVDIEDLSATRVASEIRFPERQVFKTLVVKGDQTGIVLAVVPGDLELDLKALARASGNRRIEMISVTDLPPLTGYVRGGVTALACKREFPVYLDVSAKAYDTISVSAGVRGVQILLAPYDYIRASGPVLAQISRLRDQRGR